MKEFENLEVEVVDFTEEDVVSTSNQTFTSNGIYGDEWL